MKIFVTGTDTDVGKTVASAWLIKTLGASYWKPIQSGLDGETDIEVIRRLTSIKDEQVFPPAYELPEPLSPHESARRAGVRIEMERIKLPELKGPLVIEGAGGIMVPLNERHMMRDLMVQLGVPVILVCRSGLGTINHTLLSLQALREKNIDILGVILNGPYAPHNADAIREFGKIEILAQIPHLSPLTEANISSIAAESDLTFT